MIIICNTYKQTNKHTVIYIYVYTYNILYMVHLYIYVNIFLEYLYIIRGLLFHLLYRPYHNTWYIDPSFRAPLVLKVETWFCEDRAPVLTPLMCLSPGSLSKPSVKGKVGPYRGCIRLPWSYRTQYLPWPETKIFWQPAANEGCPCLDDLHFQAGLRNYGRCL